MAVSRADARKTARSTWPSVRSPSSFQVSIQIAFVEGSVGFRLRSSPDAGGAEAAAVMFAVTDLFLVSTESIESAIEICEISPRFQSFGVDWGNGDRVLQLCLRRERIDVIKSPAHVVQRIAVYSSLSSCLSTESVLFRPQDGVVVCVRRVPASPELLSSGNFLSDVWVPPGMYYNSDVPGWSGISISVREPPDTMLGAFWQWLWTPPYEGAFISYQKPTVAIRDGRLVTTDADPTADTCMAELRHTWESTGDALDVEGDRTKKALLCIRRGGDEDTSPSLVDVFVDHSSSEECSEESTSVALPSRKIALCLIWRKNADMSSRIIDLRLGPHSKRPPTGQFMVASDMDINRIGSRKIYLYAQMSWQPLEPIEEHPDENGLLGKPPLVATVESSGNSISLSYKILQLTELHYSGDPTTSCHDAPLAIDPKDCSEALMTKFVSDLLDVEKPDFVAFTGDNVQVYRAKLRQRAIDAATAEVVKRGIPFAVIFGNHDEQNGFSRVDQLKAFVKKPLAYARRGPANVGGIGNYELSVQAPVGGPWGSAGSDSSACIFSTRTRTRTTA